MGWASGGAIFDKVAYALVKADASDDLMRAALGPLIEALQDGDWDTEDESLNEFGDVPVIVELFHQHGVGNTFWDGNAEGELDWSEQGDMWSLRCNRHGLLASKPDAAGHDELVHDWAAHAQAEHGGNGHVDQTVLLRPEVHCG